MPAVLVHGVPETPIVWEPLAAALERTDVITPQLPGFGTPAPPGWEATKDEYVSWLIDELEAVGEPVDLVGHDWGAGLTVRLVSVRPDLVRSWAVDGIGFGSPLFEWHDLARLWQTPGEGEAFMDQQLAASTEERGALLASVGVPGDHATKLGEMLDEEMARCILALYRSAVHLPDEWAPDFVDIEAHGAHLNATEDPFRSERVEEPALERSGAVQVGLDGLGHWWMLEDPQRAASAIEGFWATA